MKTKPITKTRTMFIILVIALALTACKPARETQTSAEQKSTSPPTMNAQRDSNKSSQESIAAPTAPSAKSAEKGEIDILTFMKALAEGKTEDYKGFLVRGSGVAAEKNMEGEGASTKLFATLFVCGKSPDGTYTLIEKTGKDSVKGINFATDRLLKVQLVWEKLPQEFTSGLDFVVDAQKTQKMCDHFTARFNGKYHGTTTTIGDAQGKEEKRKDDVPILIWEK